MASMEGKKFYLIVLIALVALLGYLSYQVLKPFLAPIAWAIVLAILFYPLYKGILRFVRWDSLASLLVVAVALIAVIGPFTYFSVLLVQEMGDLVEDLRRGKTTVETLVAHPALQAGVDQVASWMLTSREELNKALADQVSRLAMELFGRVTGGVRNLIGALLSFIIMALTLFFLFKAGAAFFDRAQQYLPFSPEQRNRLIREVEDIIISTIYGGVIIALVQGTMGGAAFYFLGLSSPVLWGFAMALASFLPLVGPFIIWAPASLFLFFQGAVGKAVLLTVIGAGAISSVDYFLRPMIIGKRTRMPFLFIFFSVLGGIQVFGILGFVVGPMVLALFISVIEIFRTLGEESLQRPSGKEKC
jgi:predicted PurR-regulated permease PerM